MTSQKPVMCTIGPAMQAMIDDSVKIRRAGWAPDRFLVYNRTKQLAFEYTDSECLGVTGYPPSET